MKRGNRVTAAGRAGRRRFLWAAGIAACAGLPVAQAGVPALPALRRGVNLSHWFEYEQGQGLEAGELRDLKGAGFDHVRIPVDPVVGGWRPTDGSLHADFMQALRRAIEMAIGAGLAVVFDLHMTAPTREQIEAEPALEPRLQALWREIAVALADLPPSHLAFELYNEPQYYGRRASRWPVLQRTLLTEVRRVAPRHLVLLSGTEGGSLQGLIEMPVRADPALAWVFHYYEPFLFTHQGAHWLDTRYTTAGLRSNVRYPVLAQFGHVPGLAAPHPQAARELAAYRAGQWGAARVREDIDRAGAFARQHGLKLLCNEFGVIRAHVDAASRYRWITDVRTALEANAIGWTLWDYSDIFGVAEPSAVLQRSAPRTLPQAALQALGLTS